MFGIKKKKNCFGCKEEIEPKGDDCVQFKIKNLVINTPANDRQYYKRNEAVKILLHDKCLIEHIWIVEKYALQTIDFYEIDIETRINGKKIAHIVGLDEKNVWTIKTMWKNHYDGTNELDSDLKCLLKRIIEKEDVILVCFQQKNKLSMNVPLSKNNSILRKYMSDPYYKEKVKIARAERDSKYQELKEISVRNRDEFRFFQTDLDFAYKCECQITSDTLSQ